MNVWAKSTVPCISCQSECERRSVKKKASRAHGRWMMSLCCVESYLSESWIINRGGGVNSVNLVLGDTVLSSVLSGVLYNQTKYQLHTINISAQPEILSCFFCKCLIVLLDVLRWCSLLQNGPVVCWSCLRAAGFPLTRLEIYDPVDMCWYVDGIITSIIWLQGGHSHTSILFPERRALCLTPGHN